MHMCMLVSMCLRNCLGTAVVCQNNVIEYCLGLKCGVLRLKLGLFVNSPQRLISDCHQVKTMNWQLAECCIMNYCCQSESTVCQRYHKLINEVNEGM